MVEEDSADSRQGLFNLDHLEPLKKGRHVRVGDLLSRCGDVLF